MEIINITVKSSAGTTLAGAVVSYKVDANTITGTTDTNGLFIISDLPAGPYTFAAALSGHY
jgi:hypothetical protein